MVKFHHGKIDGFCSYELRDQYCLGQCPPWVWRVVGGTPKGSSVVHFLHHYLPSISDGRNWRFSAASLFGEEEEEMWIWFSILKRVWFSAEVLSFLFAKIWCGTSLLESVKVTFYATSQLNLFSYQDTFLSLLLFPWSPFSFIFYLFLIILVILKVKNIYNSSWTWPIALLSCTDFFGQKDEKKNYIKMALL